MSDTTEQLLLSDLRKRAGLSQSEVARRMGVNRPRVGQIERDFPRVRFNVLTSYIEALGGVVAFEDALGDLFHSDQIKEDPRERRSHGKKGVVKWIPASELPGDGAA